MALKEISRSATCAFCPTEPLIAMGTMAGAVDSSFSTNSAIEVFQVDMSSSDSSFPSYSSAKVNERFNRLVWGKAKGLSWGIIAGGLADGTISLWDPAPKASPKALTTLSHHTGSVRGLDFNTFSQNLLASGGNEGDVVIWDLTIPSKPSKYPALKSGAASSNNEISCLAWNGKVNHILASADSSGQTVVWDLKKQRPVISFHDPSVRRRCSALGWSPDHTTQLIVASDDDRSPTLQVWDLRNSISPLREIAGHSKGILNLAWSPHDKNLLLTCGKDNRTICWDIAAGEPIWEMHSSTNWNFDAEWSPLVPGVFTTSSFDGNVSLYSLLSSLEDSATPAEQLSGEDFFESKSVNTSTKIGSSSYAPAWLRRPCGATFGFGARLASVTPDGKVTVCNIISNPQVVEGAKIFKEKVSNASDDVLTQICTEKVEGSEVWESETWKFIRTKFSADPKNDTLKLLGYEPQESSQVEDAKHMNSAQNNMNGNEEEFFETLGATSQATEGVQALKIGDTRGTAVPPEKEEEIKKALVIGDYSKAASLCLAAGQPADALVIAALDGQELLDKITKLYMSSSGTQSRIYMQTASAIVSRDLNDLVETADIEFWKETLATLITFAQDGELSDFASKLADNILSSKSSRKSEAAICHIVAGNIHQAVDLWSSIPVNAASDKEKMLALQNVVEKAVILGIGARKAMAQSSTAISLQSLAAEFANILAGQGELGLALDYLALLNSQNSSVAEGETAFLLDRVYKAADPEDTAGHKAPTTPYQRQAVPSSNQFFQTYQNNSRDTMNPRQPANSARISPQQPLGSSSVGTLDPAYTQNIRHTPHTQPPPFQPLSRPVAHVASPPMPNSGMPPMNPIPGMPYTPPIVPQPTQLPGQMPTAPAVPPFSSQGVNSKRFHGAAVAAPQDTKLSATAPAPAMPMGAQQPVPVPVQKASYPMQNSSMPPVAPPADKPQPFNPVAQPPSNIFMNPAGAQNVPTRPSPSEPIKQAPSPPPNTCPPNISIQTADISKVSPELQPVVTALTRFYNECLSLSPPGKKREMEDNSKRFGTLFWKLNNQDVSTRVSEALAGIAKAVSSGDWQSAHQLQAIDFAVNYNGSKVDH